MSRGLLQEFRVDMTHRIQHLYQQCQRNMSDDEGADEPFLGEPIEREDGLSPCFKCKVVKCVLAPTFLRSCESLDLLRGVIESICGNWTVSVLECAAWLRTVVERAAVLLLCLTSVAVERSRISGLNESPFWSEQMVPFLRKG